MKRSRGDDEFSFGFDVDRKVGSPLPTVIDTAKHHHSIDTRHKRTRLQPNGFITHKVSAER